MRSTVRLRFTRERALNFALGAAFSASKTGALCGRRDQLVGVDEIKQHF